MNRLASALRAVALVVLLALCVAPAFAASEDEATQNVPDTPCWKLTAMAGTHMFVDYLGGVRVGAAPEMGLRASYWFVNKWGRRETGVGVDYSGFTGRVAGQNFAYNRLGVNLMWDMIKSLSGAHLDNFGAVPYIHMSVASAPHGVALPWGIGGYLEWRFDEHLSIQGELRGSFLSAKKVRDVNGNFNIAGNASATVGVSWAF